MVKEYLTYNQVPDGYRDWFDPKQAHIKGGKQKLSPLFFMYVYILYSAKADIFYIGFTTETVEIRLQRHLTGYYPNKFTSKVDDWEIFFTLECISVKQGMSIEKHIKKMKSKTYIKNLKLYPGISEKLLEKYK